MKKNLITLCFSSVLFFLCLFSNSNIVKAQSTPGTGPELKSIFINGDSTHYIDIGKGEPVVFVHGALSDYRSWGAQMDEFAKSYRVIAYSRRYAYPNKQVINDTADYSFTVYAKDLVELLQKLNLGPVHLVGHSSGAYTALLATMDEPGLVRSLTLGEAPVMSMLQNVPGGDTLVNNFVTKAAIPAAEAFKNNNEEKAVKLFITAVMDDSSYFSKLPEQVRAGMMANTLETRGSVLNKNIFPPVSCDDLSKIKTPVLLVAGDKSPLFLHSITKELNRCLRNKENAVLLNTSHGLGYENPEAFNKVVLSFIDKH